MTDNIPAWQPFELRELPLSPSDEKHSRTCPPCGRTWTASATAIHEATHAAVALKLGLGVEFVSIDDEHEVEVSRAEVALYPMVLKPGMMIPATITRLDPREIQRHREEVLVAMVAPSCVQTGHRLIDDYAAIEAMIAKQRASLWKLDTDRIFDRAKTTVESVEQEILALAAQLAEHGWVDAPTL